MWKWFLNKVEKNIQDKILTEVLNKIQMHQNIYVVDGDFMIRAGNNNMLQLIVNSYGPGPAVSLSVNDDDFPYEYYSPSVLWYPFNGYYNLKA